MAEIALIASIVQIADTGYRLSLKLYTFGEAVSSADRAIITISKDISVVSTVLKELGQILGRDEDNKERICSDIFVLTAGNTVKECLEVFEELDKMILKNMPNLSQGNKATRATMALEKLKWPFIQPRIQLLRGNLDMLRANISLMLNVLIYARQESERRKLRVPDPDIYDEAVQKILIEEIANAKKEYSRKFESLKLSITSPPSTQNMHDRSRRAPPAYPEENLEPKQHSFDSPPGAIFQNARAPQWPLPSDLASRPMMPKDPQPVQSDQYGVQQLLGHFDALLRSLIRQVYAPEYRITAGSRSRFTSAIRETHTLEVTELRRSEPSKSGDSGMLEQSEPSPHKTHQRHTARAEFVPMLQRPVDSITYRQERPIITGPYGVTSDKMVRQCSGKGVFKSDGEVAAIEEDEEARKRRSLMKAKRRRQWEEIEPDGKTSPTVPLPGQRSELAVVAKPCGISNENIRYSRYNMSMMQTAEKEDRNDVVDNLLRLWTLL